MWIDPRDFQRWMQVLFALLLASAGLLAGVLGLWLLN